MNEARHDAVKPAPFDTGRLDALLDDEGIDVLVVTSKHNVQYLLGGYRSFFFDYMDAIDGCDGFGDQGWGWNLAR
jgi:Xaa-Pro aminopeptidase